MNIVVVGPGAIGSLWAYSLAQAGHNVSLWGTQQDNQWSVALDEKPALHFPYNQKSPLIDADLILVTVKAWQVKTAISPLLSHVHSDAIFLFMHNGMGAIEEVADSIKQHPILIATTTHGALKDSPNHVKHTGLGQTQIGAFNTLGEQCSFVVEVFHHALPAVEWNSNIHNALWNKLAINCAINPLTALNQCLNGELAQEKYRSTIDAVINELLVVMQAEKIPVEKEPLTQTINGVIAATAKNKSSMYQDIFYQRQTEIDFITGYVVRTAQKHGIKVPANLNLYERIKKLEQSWITS